MSFDLRAVVSADASGFHSTMAQVRAAGHQVAEELEHHLAGLFSAAALEEGFRRLIEEAHELTNTSIRTGVSVEELQKLKYAAEMSGSSMDGMVKGIEKFAIAQAKAKNEGPGGEHFEAMKRMGLDANDIDRTDQFAANFLKAGEHIKEAAIDGQLIKDWTEVAGKNARELMTAFRMGFGELAREAPVIPEAQVLRMAEASEFIKKTWFEIKSIGADFINGIVGGLNLAAGAMVGLWKGLAAFVTNTEGNNGFTRVGIGAKKAVEEFKHAMTDAMKEEFETKPNALKAKFDATRGKGLHEPGGPDDDKAAKKAADQEERRRAHEEESTAKRLTTLAKETAEIQRKTSLEGLTDAEKRRKLTQEIHTLETMIGVQRGENDALGAAETLKEKAQREQDLKKLNTHLEPATAWMTDSLAKIGGFTGGADNRLMALQERIALASEKTADNTRPLPGGGDDELFG